MVNLLQGEFGLYYAGVFLLDEAGENAILRAGTGEPGQRMLAQHHQLPINGNSMVGWAIRNRKARIASDVSLAATSDDNQPIRFNNPQLPLTRSEIALPLLSRDKVIGALTLQSSQAGAFDEDDIIALQEVANVLAISLDNARLFEQTEEDRKEIRELHRTYLQQAWTGAAGASGDLSLIVENVSDAVRNTSGEAVTVSRQETSEGHAHDAGTMHPAEIELPLILRDHVIGQITLEADRASLSPEEMALIEFYYHPDSPCSGECPPPGRYTTPGRSGTIDQPDVITLLTLGQC